MKLNLRKIYSVTLVSIISIFSIQRNAVSQDLQNNYEVVVDARNGDQNPETIDGFTTTKNGIAVVASNGHRANVEVVDGIVSSQLGAYIQAGDSTTNPQTTGDATLTIDGIVGGMLGVSIVSRVEGSVATLISNDNVMSGRGIGGLIQATDSGAANVYIYNHVLGLPSGLDFELTDGGTSNALVSGVIAGEYGVRITKDASNNASLTTLQIKHKENGDFIGGIGLIDNEDIEKFAKRINYIIAHNDNIVLKKADGTTDLDTSYEYPVAKEGDRVIIAPLYDELTVKAVFNNGQEVTTKDEKGRFYIDVKRGGGYSLTAQIEKLENPMRLKAKRLKAKAIVLAKRKLTRAFSKAVQITDAEGTLSYKKKKGAKKIVIDKATGKITIKKGLAKGTYKIKVNVSAAGNQKYKSVTKGITFTLNVK